MQGMTDAGREVVGPMVLAAWDDFLALVDETALDAPSRLPGWRAHEVCVHLGVWPERDGLAEVLAAAREGRTDRGADSDEINAMLTSAHRDATRDEVISALLTARNNAATYFADADDSLDTLPTGSTVGPLPVLSVLLAGTYELAVHALDLTSAGGPEPSDDLLLTGLAALAEVSGALGHRVGVHARASLHSPIGGWAFASDEVGWQVQRIGVERPAGATVEGDAASLLDLSAGRINPIAALTRGHLRVHDLPGLLRLAPIVEAAPGIPGAPVLVGAARTLTKVTRPSGWLSSLTGSRG